MTSTGPELYKKAKTMIPGGTQLLSKRPELWLPENWPSYYTKVKGAEVWDLDGKKYVDMVQNGVGTCPLGAADTDVDAAVKTAIANGTMSTLNCPEEVELAELLLELHPWAHMVRYARCGGEAMAIAVRIVRAASGRDDIAFCGYHGWHDWYLSANLAEDHTLDGHLLPGLSPKGVPRGLKGLMHPFRYNHIEELEAIIARGVKPAAIVMEPQRDQEPQDGFLQKVRDIATQCGAALVFDEVTSGFRMNCGGIHLLHGVEPDVAVFAKALGNGYPMAAIIGKKSVMQAAQETFISSTNWTERIGPTAALAMIRKHRAKKVHEHLIHMGNLVRSGWQQAADTAKLSIEVSGLIPLSHLKIHCDHPQQAMTLYTQEMLKRGYLAGSSFYATYAHTEKQVKGYLKQTTEVFQLIAAAIADGTLEKILEGPVAHSGFKRLA